MTEKKSSENTGNMENNNQMNALEHAPHLEPLFWGTGEMLVWETTQLLSSVDTTELFRTEWAKEILSEDELKHLSDTVFTPIFNELSTLIVEKELIDARGFYSYFPVIIDNREVIVLDPSDFHTPLFSCSFFISGRRLADFFIPVGDMIAFGAVTIGGGITSLIRTLAQKSERESKSFYCSTLGRYLINMLARRITEEIRRGVGMTSRVGCSYTFDSSDKNQIAVLPSLIETLAIEERLGILFTGDTLIPEFSRLFYFVHHPQAQPSV
jgi:cobalamin-dependent methionine synthase I